MTKALVITLSCLLAGCASMRGVDVGTDPGASYRIEVYNSRTASVTVSYTDGGSPIQLGNVGARATEPFVIASPRSTSIEIRALTANGNSAGTYPVELAAGTTKRVTIR